MVIRDTIKRVGLRWRGSGILKTRIDFPSPVVYEP